MGKSCGKHNFFSMGGQYYSLGHPIEQIMTILNRFKQKKFGQAPTKLDKIGQF